jgi:hypothetical protein
MNLESSGLSDFPLTEIQREMDEIAQAGQPDNLKEMIESCSTSCFL